MPVLRRADACSTIAAVSTQEELRVVGAGLGRTGTHSLKLALEQLLEGRCYHMVDLLGQRERDVPLWLEAARSGRVDSESLLSGYRAIVDIPGCFFWRELAEQHPDALVLLSTRETAEAWWQSASSTIFDGLRRGLPGPLITGMWSTLAERSFTPHIDDREQAIAAYERHNADVRSAIPASRLVEWRPGDGWGPLCRALGVGEPDLPFPHTNSTEEFLARRSE